MNININTHMKFLYIIIIIYKSFFKPNKSIELEI